MSITKWHHGFSVKPVLSLWPPQHTYTDAVSAANTCSQSNHGARKAGHTAAVPVVLGHLTGQDTGDKRSTNTWR